MAYQPLSQEERITLALEDRHPFLLHEFEGLLVYDRRMFYEEVGHYVYCYCPRTGDRVDIVKGGRVVHFYKTHPMYKVADMVARLMGYDYAPAQYPNH